MPKNENGWRHLDWFGWFYAPQDGDGWIYNEEFGWAYTDGDSRDSFNLYYPGWSWTWTSESFYPFSYFQYSFPQSGWKYFYRTVGQPQFYRSNADTFWRANPYQIFTQSDYASMDFVSTQLESLGPLQQKTDVSGYNIREAFFVHGGIGPFPSQSDPDSQIGYNYAALVPGERAQLTYRIELPDTIPAGTEVDVIVFYSNNLTPTNNNQDQGFIPFLTLDQSGQLLPIPVEIPFDEAEVPRLTTFVAGQSPQFIGVYEGAFWGVGWYNFSLRIRFTTPEGDTVVYGPTEEISLNVNRPLDSPKPDEVIVADSGFRTTPDGFPFNNPSGAYETLTPEDVYRLMGDYYVTREGDNFTFTPLGCFWAITRQLSATGGHCFGIALTATRIFHNLPSLGKRGPETFQEGATSTFDIQLSNAIDEINFWMISQENPNFWKVITETLERKPSVLLENYINLLNSDELHLAALVMNDRDDSGGHAVVPYMVTQTGPDLYRVYVYDNNFPGNHTNYVQIDTRTENWEYRGNDPKQIWYAGENEAGQTINSFSGNASTKNLGFVRMDWVRQLAHLDLNDGGNPLPSPRPHPGEILFAPQGGVFILRDGPNAFGYDPVLRQMVRDWPAARFEPTPDSDVFPDIAVTLDGALPTSLETAFNDSIEVEIGNIRDEEEDVGIAALRLEAGFSISDVELDSDEIITAYAHPSGTFFGFESVEEDVTPLITFAIQDDETLRGACYQLSFREAIGPRNSEGVFQVFVWIDPADNSVEILQRDSLGNFSSLPATLYKLREL